MLLLDFCNIQEWSVEKISGLYDKHQIIHTAEGNKHGKEFFCSTKHKEKWRYYFTEEIPPILGDLDDTFCISPDRSEYMELWEMLKISQSEFRTFVEVCRNGKLDLEFINNLMNQHFIHNISEKFPVYFRKNRINKWMPEIGFDDYFLGDIESYIAWEIFEISLGRIKSPIKKRSSVFECIGKCDWCDNYYYYNRNTKRFCSTKCRQDYNYDKDVKRGMRQEYGKKWRKKHPDYYLG
jgi:hypothetical protein